MLRRFRTTVAEFEDNLLRRKRVAVPDRLSTAGSQGGDFLSGLLIVPNCSNLTIKKIWQKSP